LVTNTKNKHKRKPKMNTSGFYKLTIKQRQKIIEKQTNTKLHALKNFKTLKEKNADSMIENVIGTISIPVGIATNFIINKKPILIPMATEESSIIAACSRAAKLSNGFTAKNKSNKMTGQILLTNIKNPQNAIKQINKNKKKILKQTKNNTIIEKLGGGAKEITAKKIAKNKIEIHLIVDCIDAMGANTVNTMCEKIAPTIEKLTNGKALLKIISNLSTHRTVKAKTTWKKQKISGENTINKIIEAQKFAQLTPHRAATHNKGIMNGIDAIALATGNDWRALEAAAHTYASHNKKYSPLTKYYKNKKGDLCGEIELPITVGTVGGATKINPAAQENLKILGTKKASELAEIMAAVGLAQNFAALHAIVTEGIQKGHMRLHAKNIAINAGATIKETNTIAQKMIEQQEITETNAKKIIKKIRNQKQLKEQRK
jgi:hydroxymethylglutaryl-CoA reductase